MALIKLDELKRGDTWKPVVKVFSDKKKTIPYDVTGMTLKCHIKDVLEETASDILTLTGTWTEEANGIGEISMTHVQSLTLMVKDDPGYYVEFKIYTTVGQTVVKTIKQAILPVVEVLEKDIA